MANMDGWSVVLLAAAAFLAATSLVRLMKSRHDSLLGQLRSEWQAEQDRRVEEEQRRRREERKRRLREQMQNSLDESDQAA